jgi:hypothetical protein
LARTCTFNHDQIVILTLEAGRGKVRGTGAQQLPVDLIALEVHQGAPLVLDPCLDARRLGEVIEKPPGLALGELGAIEIDAHIDASIGGACERLHNGTVSQHIGRHVDFVLGAIDQRHVDMFKVLCRGIVNDRRGISLARRECGEQRQAAMHAPRTLISRTLFFQPVFHNLLYQA